MTDDTKQEGVVLLPGDKIGKEWTIVQKLDEGGCAVVYEERDRQAAIKVEARVKEEMISTMELFVLQRLQFSEHAPPLIASGQTATFNLVLKDSGFLHIALALRVGRRPEAKYFTPAIMAAKFKLDPSTVVLIDDDGIYSINSDEPNALNRSFNNFAEFNLNLPIRIFGTQQSNEPKKIPKEEIPTEKPPRKRRCASVDQNEKDTNDTAEAFYRFARYRIRRPHSFFDAEIQTEKKKKIVTLNIRTFLDKDQFYDWRAASGLKEIASDQKNSTTFRCNECDRRKAAKMTVTFYHSEQEIGIVLKKNSDHSCQPKSIVNVAKEDLNPFRQMAIRECLSDTAIAARVRQHFRDLKYADKRVEALARRVHRWFPDIRQLYNRKNINDTPIETSELENRQATAAKQTSATVFNGSAHEPFEILAGPIEIVGDDYNPNGLPIIPIVPIVFPLPPGLPVLQPNTVADSPPTDSVQLTLLETDTVTRPRRPTVSKRLSKEPFIEKNPTKPFPWTGDVEKLQHHNDIFNRPPPIVKCRRQV